MDNKEHKHLSSLMQIHQRRLKVLELQAANFGLHVPPHIVIEIEDIKEKIKTIEIKLYTTKSNFADQDKQYDELVPNVIQEATYQEVCLISYDYFKPVYNTIYSTTDKAMLINALYQYAKQIGQVDQINQLLLSIR